jgi:hypothetical protein
LTSGWTRFAISVTDEYGSLGSMRAFTTICCTNLDCKPKRMKKKKKMVVEKA